MTFRSCFLSSFPWIPFSGFRGEVENVSVNQRPGQPSCFFFHRPQKHKHCRGHWDPASGSCQVSMNSVQWFHRRSHVSATQKLGWPSCFSNQPKKHKLGRRRSDLATCQVSLNSVHQSQRRSQKCLSQLEGRAAILFFWSAWKTQKWYRTLRSCFLSSFDEFYPAFQRRRRKISKAIRGQERGILFFQSAPKTKLCIGHWDLASCQVLLNSVLLL